MINIAPRLYAVEFIFNYRHRKPRTRHLDITIVSVEVFCGYQGTVAKGKSGCVLIDIGNRK